MELMNSDIDDLRNKNIEINNPTDISSTTNSDPNVENNSNNIRSMSL